MKLALISSEMLPCPAIRGGAIQAHIDGVTPYLAKNHEVTVFSIADPELPDTETREGIRYLRFPRKGYAKSVAAELGNHSFDLIHVFNRPLNVPLYKASAPDSTMVMSLHNEMMSAKKIDRGRASEALDLVARVITVSDYIGATVTRRFPQSKDKVVTVYSGVDTDTFIPFWYLPARPIRQQMREAYGIQGKLVILFAGRLSTVKGPDVLIEAMKGVIEKHSNAVLVICGGRWFSDNSINKYVRHLYRLAAPLRKHVLFTKFIPLSKMPHHYAMSDIFVCSSQWQEPLARVHYEAMAAGLPIITTNAGGNPEVITDGYNGLVIQNYLNNPSAFTRAINLLLSNKGKAWQMAFNARQLAEERFRFEHAANRLEKAYLEALGDESND